MSHIRQPRSSQAQANVAEAQEPEQVDPTKKLLDDLGKRLGDPQVIENAVKAGVLGAVGEVLRHKQNTLYGTTKALFEQEGWQGKAVGTSAIVGAVGVGALGVEIIGRKGLDWESGPVSWLLSKIF